MIRFLAIVSAASALALPVMAEEEPVLFDVPPGVLIFDADPDPVESAESAPIPVPADTEPSPEPIAVMPDAPVVGGSASASLRSPSDPIIFLDPVPEEQPSALPVIEAIEPVYSLRHAASTPDDDLSRDRPEPTVDPLTGRLRDTPGWTGRTDAPASIGCFPEGACAVLNQR